MFFGKEVLGDFIDFLDKSKEYDDIIELDLLPNAPQSAIDAFNEYKKIREKTKDNNI